MQNATRLYQTPREEIHGKCRDLSGKLVCMGSDGAANPMSCWSWNYITRGICGDANVSLPKLSIGISFLRYSEERKTIHMTK